MKRYLGVVFLALVALVFGAAPASAEIVPQVPSGVSAQGTVEAQIDAATMEAEMLRLTNEYRSVGRDCPTDADHPVKWHPAVPPLRPDARLTRAARDHSLEMALNNYYAHESKVDGSTPASRVTAEGFRWTYVAENIFAYYTTAQEIVDGWINHVGHCQNIMSATATFVGNGYAFYDNPAFGSTNYKHYYTQDFAAPQPGMVFAPDAPTITSVTGADGTATVSFKPGWDGGSAITNYLYSLDNGVSWNGRSPGSAASPMVITGLRDGVTYQVRIRSLNSTFFDLGASPPSNMVAVTPKSSASVPGAPAITVMTAGDSQAWVAFSPAPSGGLPVSNYQYSTDGGAKWTAFNPVDTASPANIPGLVNGTTYQVMLRAVNALGAGAPSAAVPVTPSAPAPSVFVPINPVRVVDTRESAGGTPVASGDTRTFSVANQIAVAGGAKDVVPAGAVAIAYNVTVPAGPAAGHLRVMPGDTASSASSAINFRVNEAIANGLVVKVDTQRRIRIFNAAALPVNAIVDVVGYFMPPTQAPTGGKLTPIVPTRVYDSEQDTGVAGAVAPAAGLVGPGETRTVDVLHSLGDGKQVVPTGSQAVAYNITVVRPAVGGHLRVFPGDQASSQASTINWSMAGDIVANGLVVRIADDGTVKVYNSSGAPVRFLIDVVGYYRSDRGAQFYPIQPARSYDSRAAQPAPGKIPTGDALSGGPVRVVSVADARDSVGALAAPAVVPTGATAIAYNVTVTGTESLGHFRVFPADQAVPFASVINWPGAGYTRANGSVVGISTGRQVSIFNSSAPADGIIDTLGYYK